MTKIPLSENVSARETLDRHVEALLRDGSVARRSKELIGVMVAWLNACEY